MADVPFFRGVNRTDWLVALELQVAADWGTQRDVENVAEILGGGQARKISFNQNLIPPVCYLETADYQFVLCGSTRNTSNWIGNVIGSNVNVFPGIDGPTTAYFGLVGIGHYNAIRQSVVGGSATKKTVLVGFSLGSASACLIKELLKNNDGIDSACIAFASPRPGSGSFENSFPSINYQGVTVQGDPVPSLPPNSWSALGAVGWAIGIPPISTYVNLRPNQYLDLQGMLHNGGADQTVTEVAAKVASGEAAFFHNQALYARLLRVLLPDILTPGYEGFLGAPLIDSLAPSVFTWEPFWPFGPMPTGNQPGATPTLPPGGFPVAIRCSIFIRYRSGYPPVNYVTQAGKGFDEVYYVTGDASNLTATLNAVISKLIPARLQFLSAMLEVYAARVSVVGSPRVARLYKPVVPLPGGSPISQGVATIEDCYVYLGFDTSGQFRRQFHFRGIDALYLRQDGVLPGGTLDTLINGTSPSAFFPVYKSMNGVILSTVGTGASVYPITGATQVLGGPITLGIVAPGGVPTNDLFDVRGCKAFPILNGRWQAVGAQIANQVVLSGSQRYAANGPCGGVVKLVGASPQGFDNAALLGADIKKTGKAPFGPRGRRSPVVRRR